MRRHIQLVVMLIVVKFSESKNDLSTIAYKVVKGDNDTDTTVNADLKSVDYIMVRDRQQGPEITQPDVDAYDAETKRLSDLVDDAQKDITEFDAEVTRLEGLETDASKAVTDLAPIAFIAKEYLPEPHPKSSTFFPTIYFSIYLIGILFCQ